jgi:ATP-dependent RNA helicase DeaD
MEENVKIEETKEETQTVTFADLGLSQRVLDAIKAKGFEKPSPIQVKAIPVMLGQSVNIIAQAQTGTGKTAAFGLPLLDIVDPRENAVQALVLAPTRELAVQVAEEIKSLKGKSDLRIVPIYGGQSMSQQLRSLSRGVHIVVGTPGRVLDHIKRKTLKLQDLKYLVLDEADEMLNMGFIDDMEEVIANSNPDKHILLFSATMSDRIKRLARKYMGDYESIAVKKKELTTSLTEQIYYEVRHSAKFDALCRIVDVTDDFYGVVFCRTRNEVDTVAQNLSERGYSAEGMHGDMSQPQREKTLKKLKAKRVNILVATDVAARGIDVNNLTHVVNYALPQDPEAYVHRIGRTGRAGNKGIAVTLVTSREHRQLMYIQRANKTTIKQATLPPVKDIIAIKLKNAHEKIAKASNEDILPIFSAWAEELLEEADPKHMLATILQQSYGDQFNPKAYTSIQSSGGRDRGGERRDRGGDRGGERRDFGRDRNESTDSNGRTRLFVAMGKVDGMNPRSLVEFFMEKTGVRNQDVDEVAVMNDFSFITVPHKDADVILQTFRKRSNEGKSLVTKARAKDPGGNSSKNRSQRNSRSSDRRGGRDRY